MTKSDQAAVLNMQRAVSVEFIRQSGGYAVKAKAGQKDPAKGWDPRKNTDAKSAQTLADIEFTDDNIGVHLHGPLVDVDIDGESAEDFLLPALDAFLPSCSHVWGRKSRKRTHRAYLLKSAEPFDPAEYPVLRRIKRIEEVKVEIRGGPPTRGEYSLLPGSTHPSGEAYEWEDIGRAKNTPSVTDPVTLVRAIRLAGAIAVLGPHWQEGTRQELTMALAGFLYRASAIADSLDAELFKLDVDTCLRFIEVLQELTGDDETDQYARKKAFEMTWKKAEKGVPVTGASTIADIVGDPHIVRKLYTLLTDNPDIADIDEFVARFIIWQGPGIIIDSDQVKVGHPRPFLTRYNFGSSWGHRFVTMGEKRKPLTDMLWHLATAQRVQGLTYDPSGPHIVDTRQGRMVNQWSGVEIEPWEEEVSDDEIRQFIDYVYEVVCNEDEVCFEWVMAWCADLFQHPSDKCGTALVLVGLPGAGKSWLGHMVLGRILGEPNYAASNSIENVISNFNAAYANKLLIQCDEATNSRQKSHAAKLNAFITDPRNRIEPKGVDAYFVPLHSRVLFTSNEMETAIYLNHGADDRRYTVLEVSSEQKDNVDGYWTPFAGWLTEEVLAKIHRYFKDYQYDRALVRRPLKTEAKTIMQQTAWEPFDSWLAGMLAREHPLSEHAHYDWFDAPYGNERVIDRTGWPLHVNMTAMTRDYQFHCRTLPKSVNPEPLNESQIGLMFAKKELRGDGQRKLSVNEWDDRKGKQIRRRFRVYESPDPDKIREYLTQKYGYVTVSDKIERAVGGEKVSDTEEF